MRTYDPTTYFLLLQFRVVLTAVAFQIFFSKKLSRPQWVSIVLLTIGCIMKHTGHTNNKSTEANSSFDITIYLNTGLIFIALQALSSVIAGVYNEYLLKKDENADIMIQNIFMYIDSIICNVVLLVILDDEDITVGRLTSVFSADFFQPLLNVKVLLIIANNAAIGIITSLFLKNLNSILKTFASALELTFTAILSWIIFSIPLDFNTCLSILIVLVATWLYSKNPVDNTPKTTKRDKEEELV